MAYKNGTMIRAKARREAPAAVQPNGALAENALYIPTGVTAITSGYFLTACFPYLMTAGSYPPIGTPIYVYTAQKYGNFIPKYGTGTTVRVLASSWNIGALCFSKDVQASEVTCIPKSLAAEAVHYQYNITIDIATKTFKTFTVPTEAGVYVTGITLEEYSNAGSWWGGEAIVSQGKNYFPTTGTLDIAVFMPDGFSVSANNVRIHVWGFKTTRPLTQIQVTNPACNEGARTYKDWVKPANFQVLGAFQVGLNTNNWYPMCWGMGGSGGGTGFNWQRETTARTNSVVFAQAYRMGQDGANNRSADAVKVVVAGIQF